MTFRAFFFITAIAGGVLPTVWGQTWKPPKTSWGDPDLQGMWPGNMGVPLQRPEKLGTRTTLTDQEFAQKEAQAKKQAEADSQSTAASDSVGIGPPSYWVERGTPTRQTRHRPRLSARRRRRGASAGRGRPVDRTVNPQADAIGSDIAGRIY